MSIRENATRVTIESWAVQAIIAGEIAFLCTNKTTLIQEQYDARKDVL
jgi:hypothetical protein